MTRGNPLNRASRLVLERDQRGEPLPTAPAGARAGDRASRPRAWCALDGYLIPDGLARTESTEKQPPSCIPHLDWELARYLIVEVSNPPHRKRRGREAKGRVLVLARTTTAGGARRAACACRGRRWGRNPAPMVARVLLPGASNYPFQGGAE